jgi:hypothetical protein
MSTSIISVSSAFVLTVGDDVAAGIATKRLNTIVVLWQ